MHPIAQPLSYKKKKKKQEQTKGNSWFLAKQIW